MVLRQPLESGPLLETEADDELLAKNKEYRYVPEKMTWDPNCYECKVRYRDPKAKDLVMYLHAWRYKVKLLKYSPDGILWKNQNISSTLLHGVMPFGWLYLSIVGTMLNFLYTEIAALSIVVMVNEIIADADKKQKRLLAERINPFNK